MRTRPVEFDCPECGDEIRFIIQFDRIPDEPEQHEVAVTCDECLHTVWIVVKLGH